MTGHWGNNPPVVDPATFNEPAKSANGTNVGTPITFTDPDVGQTHTFSITAGNTSTAFAIDPSTGQITVNNIAALDIGTTPTFNLTVRVTDNGTPVFFGEATVTVNLTQASQTINFTSSAPGGAGVGGPTYNVTATATSGLTVTFTIDASATSVCSISGGSTVSFIGVGTCVIDANQAGDPNYTAAPQVQQSFAVGQGAQTINFTSTAPTDAVVGGPTYNVTATGGASGNSVTFAIDASASTVCSISAGSTVSFGPNGGTCVINANQAGNATYNAAPQAQQSFQVKQPPAITSLNSYTAQIGSALSFNVTTTGTPAPTVSQAAGGGQTGFPGGVTFTPSPGSAAIGGSVTSGGAQTYTTTMTANNGVAPNATQPFSLIITCPSITVTRNGGGAFPAGTFNVAYTGQSVTASGGTGPYTFVVATGALPTNLSLASGGGISGTPSATGTFLFTVTATDSGGCTGTSAQFSIAINPVAGGDTYNNLVNNTEAVVTLGTTPSPSTPFVPLSGFVTANDTPAGNVTVTSSNPIATTQGGSVTIAADGSFKYTPPVTVTALASDSFTYTISSNTGGTATPTTANGTVTLNLAGRVWYVNPNAGSNGNGQSQSPWNSTANIKQQPTVGGANTGDRIFVYNGPTGNLTANIPLLASQILHGEGVALAVNSVTLRSAGTAPSLTASSANVVSVNNGNTITGVTLTNSTNALISGAPAGLTVDTVTMTPTGSAHGFDITGGSGTVALTDVTMTGTSSGDVVKVNTGTQSWTFTDSPITQTSGRALNVQNKTGGGMTFDATSTVTVSAGTTDGAVTLSTNSGTPTFAFSKLALSTSGIARALFLGSTGTVNNTDTTSTLSTSDTGAICGFNCSAAIDAASTTLGLTFQNVSVSGTNANVVKAINLATVNGTLTMNGGSINTNSGRVADIDTGTASVTYAGTISHGGTGIRVVNKTAGTVTFSGATKTINTGSAANAVNLTSNIGATINFTNGGLGITTTSAVGFNATGGGTVNVTGAGNIITSGTGTALNVASTTIGASGLTFQRISKNGGTNGIVLNTTGSSGGLTVTGTGAVDSGGVIQNTTGDGIVLTSTTGPSFDRIRIQDAGGQGINGLGVNGFTLTNSTINSAGDADEESGLLFGSAVGVDNGLTGTALIQDVLIDAPQQWGLRVRNAAAGTLNLTVRRVTIQNNNGTNGEDAVSIRIEGGTTTVLIDDSDFIDTGGKGVDGQAGGSSGAVLNMTLQNSTFLRNLALPFAFSFTTQGNTTGRFKATGNTATSSTTDPTSTLGFDFNAADTSTLDASVTNNNTVNASFGTGLEFIVDDNAVGRLEVRDNTFNMDPGDLGVNAQQGMNFSARSVLTPGSAGQLHITLEGNTINGLDDASGLFGFAGFNFVSGGSGSPASSATVCMNVATAAGAGNNIINSNAGRRRFDLRQRAGTTFQIQGLTGSGADETNIQNFLNANNSGGTATGGSIVASAAGAGSTATIVNYTVATCQTPTAPPLPP